MNQYHESCILLFQYTKTIRILPQDKKSHRLASIDSTPTISSAHGLWFVKNSYRKEKNVEG